MIPIQLTLQGLYSYQEKQSIDFTRLTSAHLFGIFGTVGSGKSSILEAITFALYGRTDRLNLSGDNRNYNMMNLKSNELLIDFIFEAGSEQSTYRSTVRGRRNSRRFEEVKTLDRATYKKVDNEWLPIDQEVLTEAVGLSYENFKRTIIIPQGQFQEFLQLGDKDRTRMMKELFNLGKYELYRQVTSLESKNNALRQHIGGQRQQLGDIDPQRVSIYTGQLSQLEEELSQHNQTLEVYVQTDEQWRKLRELTLKSAEAEKEYSLLQEQEPALRELEKKIYRYEQALYRFKLPLSLLQENRKKKEERATLIATDSQRLQAREAEMEHLGKRLGELRPAYEKRDELQRKAADLDRLLQMKRVEESIATEEIRLQNGADFLDKATDRVERLKTTRQQLEDQIRGGRETMPDLALLSAIRSWHDERQYLNKQQGDYQKEMDKQSRQEKELRDEKSLLLADPLFAKLPHDAATDEWESILQAETEKIRQQQQILGEEENHLRVRERLKTYADDLTEGDPCPLCGSRHHPELFVSEHGGKRLQHLGEEKQLLELKLNHVALLSHQLSLLESRQREKQRDLKEWNEKCAAQQERVTEHSRLFIWEKYRQEEELNAAFLQAKEIEETIRKQEKALTELLAELEQEEKKRERYRSELEKIRTTVTVYRTTLSTIGQQIERIQPEQYQHTPADDIGKEKEHLLQEYEQIQKEYEENSSLLQERLREKDMLKESLKINRHELTQEQTAIDRLQEQLDTELAISSFRDIGEVTAILSETMDVEAEKEKAVTFTNQLLRGKSALEQLRQEIGGRVYDRGAHESLLTAIAALREEITQKNKEQGKITAMLKKLQEDLQSMISLGKVLDQLDARAENIKTMKSLFTASGFVNYISSVYLQHLCNAANDRFFRLTRQKLSLGITSDNNFQVRDFMNDGKVRSVKTLSGGQTFQASLSLALALADNIQQINESGQNFFFLDEGFGSLDKESLDIVFDTLKSLRKENRIVGVISHVEEMQQEIEVHLRIENHPEKGSIIHASWKE